MFLRCKTRHKDGKSHRYWSVVESRRVRGGRIIQRHGLYLGEINDGQEAAWRRSIAVFADGAAEPRQMALFPEGRALPVADSEVVQIRLGALSLRRPRQWGGCWLAGALWDQLQLDGFWSARLKPSRKGTRWLNVLKTLVCYRLLDPGSEWRLHRQWFEASAMADVLGEDIGLVQIDKLYRCLDKLLVHKEDFFSFLKGRWQSLFGIGFDVLLYDLTSTYFEIDPPAEGKRRFGYSRDKRPDCVQVVIALIVTPEGLPLAYEVMPGNTADNTILADFLARIEVQYGKANRTWVMDRGIPSEDVLAEMRQSNPPVHYLAGTPKGCLSRLETALLDKPWHDARPGVQVKLLAQDGEIYIFAESRDRVAKERAMRRRRLKKLWRRLGALRQQKLSPISCCSSSAPPRRRPAMSTPWSTSACPATTHRSAPLPSATPCTRTGRERREGRYLLRTNLSDADPAQLWRYYIQLTEIEQAFKELKSDLAHLPPARSSHRGPHLRRVRRLLPVCHPQAAPASPGAGADPAGGAGETLRHANGRRESADHRRPPSHPAALYLAGPRPAAPAATAQADPAAPAPPRITTAENPNLPAAAL
jgi:Transposase DDE domain